MGKTKHPGLLNALVDMQESIAYAARKNVLLMAEAVIVSLEAENAQLKEELAQAKRSYDGAVAAHHDAKSQYRDLIEAHRRELAGWEAAHVALDRDLAQCQQERDGACNVVAGANHLLLKAGEREARLREALRMLVDKNETSFGGLADWADCWDDAKQALKEAGT